MRSNRSGGPELERLVDGQHGDRWRSERRRAQWSSYYHRFFGRVRPGDRLSGGVAPISLDDTTRILHGALSDPRRRSRERETARRCVSQMLIYGYRPAKSHRECFDDLVEQVAVPARARSPRESLVAWGEQELGLRDVGLDPLPISGSPWKKRMGATRGLGMVSVPSRLWHSGGAFVVEKRAYLRTSLEAVHALANPENWTMLGDFFARTDREGGDADGRRLAAATPWSGVLREDFVATWNGLAVNLFRQRLKVDYTVTPTLVRSDYALMYEEDDQIVANEGFLELCSDADELEKGWIRGLMRKKIKFTSTMLNLLCPALLSMMLDSQMGGFNNFVQAPS